MCMLWLSHGFIPTVSCSVSIILSSSLRSCCFGKEMRVLSVWSGGMTRWMNEGWTELQTDWQLSRCNSIGKTATGDQRTWWAALKIDSTVHPLSSPLTGHSGRSRFSVSSPRSPSPNTHKTDRNSILLSKNKIHAAASSAIKQWRMKAGRAVRKFSTWWNTDHWSAAKYTLNFLHYAPLKPIHVDLCSYINTICISKCIS